jgi:hypothetical protein
MLVLKCLKCSTAASYLGFGTLQFSGSLRVNDALYPSKSELINKHTVKHYRWAKVSKDDALYPSKSGLINKHTVKHTVKARRGGDAGEGVRIVKHIVRTKN